MRVFLVGGECNRSGSFESSPMGVHLNGLKTQKPSLKPSEAHAKRELAKTALVAVPPEATEPRPPFSSMTSNGVVVGPPL